MDKKKILTRWLAIVLGPFSWLTDLPNNSLKAAVGIGLVVNSGSFLLLEDYGRKITHSLDDYSLLFIYPLILFFLCSVIVTWILAIIDAFSKKTSDSATRAGKKKSTSLTIAIFFSLWTWLYTYHKDWNKLVIALVVNYGAFIACLFNGVSKQGVLILVFITWLFAMTTVITRSAKCYEVN